MDFFCELCYLSSEGLEVGEFFRQVTLRLGSGRVIAALDCCRFNLEGLDVDVSPIDVRGCGGRLTSWWFWVVNGESSMTGAALSFTTEMLATWTNQRLIRLIRYLLEADEAGHTSGLSPAAAETPS